MKKTKLIATIMTICLAITTLAYGVYATTNLSFTIGANIAFKVDNFFVKADAFVYNVYNQAGDTRLGTTQTLSDGTSVTALKQTIIDNSNGLSTIDDTDLTWNLAQNLYFNSSDINDKITFRIEVANYTPNVDIKVTIGPNPDTNTATILENAGITGTAIDGTADALSTETAEIAVATYELSVTDLTSAINLTTISLKVEIKDNYNPYQRIITSENEGRLPWSSNLLLNNQDTNYLITWFDEENNYVDYDTYYTTLSQGESKTITAVTGYELLTIEGDDSSIFRNDTTGTCYLSSFNSGKFFATTIERGAIPPYYEYQGTFYKVYCVDGDDDYGGMIEPYQSSLRYLQLPYTITDIDDYAFDGSCAISYIIPNSITAYGNYSFEYSSLNTFIVSSYINYIGTSCFEGCSSLSKVYIDNETIASGITSNTVYGDLVKNIPSETGAVYIKEGLTAGTYLLSASFVPDGTVTGDGINGTSGITYNKYKKV